MRNLNELRYLRESQGWFFFKKYFKDVGNPLFHGTSGPKSMQVVRQGFKMSADNSNYGEGNTNGISFTRSLPYALQRHFGNFIFVVDRDEVARRYEVQPFSYPGFSQELEERVLTAHLPPKYIKGFIINTRSSRRMLERENFPVPVVFLNKDEKWEKL